MDINPLRFYVYAYLREDGSPYYIGKGQGRRAFVRQKYHQPPRDKARIVFLERNLTELGAHALERRMIRWYGRKDIVTGILRNMSAGGEGQSGYSPETLQKMRDANLGKVVSEETRLKQKLLKRGIKQPKELAAKRAAAHRGMKRPQDFCDGRKGSGNPNSAPVTVNGKFYVSKADAINALNVSRYILEKLIRDN